MTKLSVIRPTKCRVYSTVLTSSLFPKHIPSDNGKSCCHVLYCIYLRIVLGTTNNTFGYHPSIYVLKQQPKWLLLWSPPHMHSYTLGTFINCIHRSALSTFVFLSLHKPTHSHTHTHTHTLHCFGRPRTPWVQVSTTSCDGRDPSTPTAMQACLSPGRHASPRRPTRRENGSLTRGFTPREFRCTRGHFWVLLRLQASNIHVAHTQLHAYMYIGRRCEQTLYPFNLAKAASWVIVRYKIEAWQTTKKYYANRNHINGFEKSFTQYMLLCMSTEQGGATWLSMIHTCRTVWCVQLLIRFGYYMVIVNKIAPVYKHTHNIYTLKTSECLHKGSPLLL